MNCPRMDGSPRDPLGLPLTPPRVPAHPVQSDTDNVVGGSQDAARHGLSRRAQPTSPQLANGDPLSVSLDAPSHDFSGCACERGASTLPWQERQSVVMSSSAAMRWLPPSLGSRWPVSWRRSPTLPQRWQVKLSRCKAARLSRCRDTLLRLDVFRFSFRRRSSARWQSTQSLRPGSMIAAQRGQSLMIGIRSPPPCELEPWLGQRVVADDGMQGKRFCVSKRRLYPTRA